MSKKTDKELADLKRRVKELEEQVEALKQPVGRQPPVMMPTPPPPLPSDPWKVISEDKLARVQKGQLWMETQRRRALP